MPSTTQCTHCHARYTMPDHLSGKRVKCRKCGSVFVASFGTGTSAAPVASTARQPADDPFAALNELEQPSAGTTQVRSTPAGGRVQPAAVGFSQRAQPGDEIALAPDTVARPGKSKPPRRRVEIDLPYANVIDGLLPLVLLIAWLGLTVWGLISTAGRDDKPVAPWAIYVMGAIAVATFLIFVVPLMTLGTAIASRVRNFFLPDFAAFRLLGTVAGFFLMLMLLLGKLGAPLAAPVTRGELTGALPIAALVAVGLLALWFRVGLVNSAVLIPLALVFAIPGFFLAGMIQRAAGGPIARSAQLIPVMVPGQGLKRMTKTEFAKYQEDERARLARQTEAANAARTANTAVASATQTPNQTDTSRATQRNNSAQENLTGPRQTPDGKPVPPPPVDSDGAFANAQTMAPTKSAASTLLPVLATADAANPPLIGQFDALLAPERPSPWVFVRRRAEPGRRGYTVERLKATDWKPDGSLSFETDATDVACSPNGEFLVRKVRNGTQELLEISSFAEGKTLHNLPLQAASPELVGFVGDKDFAVYGTPAGAVKGATLWIVDAKAGSVSRSFQFPGARRGAVGISPDGKTIAVATKTDGPPQVILYSATGGVRKRLPLPDVGDAFFFEPKAIAFDATGQKLALEVAQQNGAKLYCWTEDGKPLASHSYPGFEQAVGAFALRDAGPRLEWVGGGGGGGDDAALLVAGRLLLDAQSGRFVGRVGEGNVQWHRALGDGRLLLRQRVAAEERFDVVTLDTARLAESLAAARKAGPLLFDPPPLDEKKAAWSVQGVNARNDQPAGRLGANPDPSPASAGLSDKPIPLGDHPIGHIRDVFFGTGVAVVYFNAVGEGGRWDAGAGAGAELVRYDLSTGKEAGRVSVPMWGEPLGVSPDGELAIIAGTSLMNAVRAPANVPARTQRGGRAGRGVTQAPVVAQPAGGASKTTTRLDLWSIGTGRYVAGWVPYAAAPDETQREVRWAAMTDRDTVLTLSNGGVLIRWSVAGRKASWGRTGVGEPPAVSPGGKYLVARASPAAGQNATVLVIDPAAGPAVSAFATPPLVFKSAHPPTFSDDGKTLLDATNAGLLRWDVASGSVQTVLTDPQTQPVDPLLGGRHALIGDRLFDLDQHAAAFTYRVAAGGQHLYDGPGGRHWYVAPGAADGLPYLCSAAIPTDAQLQAAQALAQDPPLIRPGAKVDLQVNAGSATSKVTELLRTRMNNNGLAVEGAPGPAVATLRVAAQLVNTNETIPAQVMGPGGGRTENVPVNNYHCAYDLLDARGNVLYGSPEYHVIQGRRVGMVNLTQANQSIASRIQEELDQQVLTWAASIYVPSYLTADGKVPPKPEAVLGVESSGG